HEVAHLVGGPLPVLGRERVDGEPVDAQLEAAVGGVEEGLLAGGVALGAPPPAPLRPPSVALHDGGDLARHPRGVHALDGHGATLPLRAGRPTTPVVTGRAPLLGTNPPWRRSRNGLRPSRASGRCCACRTASARSRATRWPTGSPSRSSCRSSPSCSW